MDACDAFANERARPLIDRVVLGTVQLGLPYGTLASEPLMPLTRVEAILERAWSIGVRAFDTAEAYGCAAERLSGWLQGPGRLGQAHIVTKVTAGSDSLAATLPRMLDRFGGAASCTVLSHGFIGRADWDRFVDAVERRNASAGQSVYGPDEVRQAVSFPRTARVQAPGNIFDARARDARGSSAIPLDLRSVYLQGILLSSPESASRRVPGGGALAKAVSEAAAHAGAPASELLLAAAVRDLRAGDRLVVGVDNPDHVSSVASAVRLASELASQLDSFESDVRRQIPDPVSDRLLDPRQWTA